MAAGPRPWPATATGAAALLAVTLAGCSGTAFGDRLAGSFSAGAPPTAAPQPAAPPAPATQAPEARPAAPTTPKAPAANEQAKARGSAPFTPAPYRITIQLPAADPSAPAEAVTEALRRAGVSFEVDRIERVEGNGGSAPPATPAPAPAPAATARPRN